MRERERSVWRWADAWLLLLTSERTSLLLVLSVVRRCADVLALALSGGYCQLLWCCGVRTCVVCTVVCACGATGCSTSSAAGGWLGASPVVALLVLLLLGLLADDGAGG